MPGTQFRENPIKVPSCDAHNSTKCKDDEYLLFVLISHFGNNTVAANQILTKILRALRRRPHLKSIYTKTTKDVLLEGKTSHSRKRQRSLEIRWLLRLTIQTILRAKTGKSLLACHSRNDSSLSPIQNVGAEQES